MNLVPANFLCMGLSSYLKFPTAQSQYFTLLPPLYFSYFDVKQFTDREFEFWLVFIFLLEMISSAQSLELLLDLQRR